MSEYTPAPPSGIGRSESPDIRLRGRWLPLARLGWLLIAMLIILLIAAGIPFEFAYYKGICRTAACATELAAPLTPERTHALQALGLSTDFYAAYTVALEVVAAIVYAAVGAVIFWHRSHDRMGMFAAFTLLTFGCGLVTGQLATHAPALWLPAACAYYLGQASFGIFFYLFPDGRFVPRWTRWLAAAASIWWAVSIFFPDIPLNFNGPAFLGFITTLVVAQVYRYRRVSNAVQRQQTKWVVYGFAIAIGGFVGAIALQGLVEVLLPPGPLGQMLANGLLTGLLMLIPLAIGMAILRSRLYDIDIIIRRTLVYSLLTLTLGLVYLGCILISRTLIAPLTGGSELAIVASTLAIAALFLPLRRRIQALIDKRFYRRKYDAAKVLAAFAATACDETDLTELTAELLRVVDTTVQPEFAGLWLKPAESKSRESLA
jgi:hypothetical protein